MANGAFALSSNTTGFNNTANGFEALKNNTTGGENAANGASARGGRNAASSAHRRCESLPGERRTRMPHRNHLRGKLPLEKDCAVSQDTGVHPLYLTAVFELVEGSFLCGARNFRN